MKLHSPVNDILALQMQKESYSSTETGTNELGNFDNLNTRLTRRSAKPDLAVADIRRR